MLSPSAIKKQLALFLLLSILGLSATKPYKTETEKVCKIERISVVSVDKSNRRDSAATVYHYGSNGRLDSTTTVLSGKSIDLHDAGTEVFFYSTDGLLTKMTASKNRNGTKILVTATWEYDQKRLIKAVSSEIHSNNEKLVYSADIEREYDTEGNFITFKSVTKSSVFTHTLQKLNKYKKGRLVEIKTVDKGLVKNVEETTPSFKLNDAGLVLEYKDKENNIKIVYEYNEYGEKTRQEFHKDGQMKNYEEWEYDDKKYINKIVQPMTMGGKTFNPYGRQTHNVTRHDRFVRDKSGKMVEDFLSSYIYSYNEQGYPVSMRKYTTKDGKFVSETLTTYTISCTEVASH